MSAVKTLFTGPAKPKVRPVAQPQVARGPSAEDIRRDAEAQETSKAERARIRTRKARTGSRQSSILNTPSGVAGDAPVLKKTLG